MYYRLGNGQLIESEQHFTNGKPTTQPTENVNLNRMTYGGENRLPPAKEVSESLNNYLQLNTSNIPKDLV